MRESQRRAQNKYDAANTIQIKMKLNRGTDADIIEMLDMMSTEQGGKQGYIKHLIRKDIEQRDGGAKAK